MLVPLTAIELATLQTILSSALLVTVVFLVRATVAHYRATRSVRA